jgi:DNA primase
MSPAEDKEIIRDRIDIVELINAHTRLKRSGARYKGLCPFHREKTPSFTVDPESKMWHCFGCGAGGDIYTFVEMIENVDFPEAVQILARKAGVELTPFNEQDQGRSRDRQMIKRINDLAVRYFGQVLQSPKMGASFRTYLGERAMPEDLVRDYRLGASPPSWDGIIKTFEKKKINAFDLEKAGLVVSSQGGRRYARFRNRLMFPLTNVVGEVVGFAGRAMGDDMPKYLNTPETLLFDKSRMLYNMDRAKKNIVDGAMILVEGYMDVLGLARAGILNAVASMGTALTSQQVDMMRRYCSKVFLAYDSDIAGDAAAMRGINILIERGFDIRVVTMPQGKDPDDLVREGGADAFRERMAQAANYFDHFLAHSMRGRSRDDAAAMHEIILDMAALIRKSQNELLQDQQIKRLSQALGVDEARVRSVMSRAGKQKPGAKPEDPEMTVRTLSGGVIVEKKVIQYLFSDEAYAAKILERLEASDFNDKKMRALFRYCMQYKERHGGFRPDDFLNETHPREVVSIISGVSLTKPDDAENKDAYLDALLDKLRTDVKKRRMTELKTLIFKAESEGDKQGVARYAKELTSIKQELTHKK